MNKKPYKTKLKPPMMVRETFYKTKKFVHRTFKNLKTLLDESCKKLPKTYLPNPILLGRKKINFKKQKLPIIYKGFSRNSKHDEVVKEKKKSTLGPIHDEVLKEKKESTPEPIQQTKGDEECGKGSKSNEDDSELRDLKEDKNTRKYTKVKPIKLSFQGVEAFAQKMKELEMMDVNDVDHMLDVQEVLHYYSQLSYPAYIEIVNKFFMDMHIEFSVLPPSTSLNSSMRKVGAASIHTSMRSLGPLKIQNLN